MYHYELEVNFKGWSIAELKTKPKIIQDQQLFQHIALFLMTHTFWTCLLSLNDSRH